MAATVPALARLGENQSREAQMIEDEDSKVRRNLVVFSTMILVVTFLQVQPVKLIQEALKLQDLGIPPWKTWVMVALTLAYLRYRFNTSTAWKPGDVGAGAEAAHLV